MSKTILLLSALLLANGLTTADDDDQSKGGHQNNYNNNNNNNYNNNDNHYSNNNNNNNNNNFNKKGYIYFMARRSSSLTDSKSSVVTYDQLDCSSGSTAFNTKTGTFTVPRNGVYAFSFQGLRYNCASGDLRVKLLVNGSPLLTSFASPNGVSVGLFSVLSLKYGDRVSVLRDSGTLYDTHEHFTSFSGFQLN